MRVEVGTELGRATGGIGPSQIDPDRTSVAVTGGPAPPAGVTVMVRTPGGPPGAWNMTAADTAEKVKPTRGPAA